MILIYGLKINFLLYHYVTIIIAYFEIINTFLFFK
jgi:hypothetical protein